MNNNFLKHEKSDKIKWIIAFAAILLLGVFVLAACTNGFSDANPYGWFEKETETEDATQADDTSDETTPVTEPAVEIHNTQFMKLAATKTVSETPALMNTRAATGITLTATMVPNTATNKAVDWTVEFVNPSSSWASGKKASDYVSVVPTSDGALTATVSAVSGFGEQIKIVVTARSNPEATAYCLVDYGRRLADSATMTFSNELFASNGSLNTNGVQSVESIKSSNWQAMNASYGRSTFTYEPSYKSGYTVENSTANITVSVKPSDSFYSALKSQGIANSSNGWETVTIEYIGGLYEGLISGQLIPTDGLNNTVFENIDKFNNAILASTGTYDFEIKISVNTDYETKDYVIQCKFNRNGAAFSATSVSLDRDTIVL